MVGTICLIVSKYWDLLIFLKTGVYILSSCLINLWVNNVLIIYLGIESSFKSFGSSFIFVVILCIFNLPCLSIDNVYSSSLIVIFFKYFFYEN